MHRHRYIVTCTGHDEVTARCPCGKERSRPATAAERRSLKDMLKVRSRRHNPHAVCWDFERRFLKRDRGEVVGWKWTGWAFIERVERWAKGRPQVRLTWCDDTSFMSSLLVLIEHAAYRRYMGTSLMVIPQNGESPTMVFLYPSHTERLIDTLLDIRKVARPLEAQDRYDEKKAHDRQQAIDDRYHGGPGKVHA